MMGKSKRLNGYWESKTDPSITIYVERVYKKGYITGIKSVKVAGVIYQSQIKLTHEELQEGFEREGEK